VQTLTDIRALLAQRGLVPRKRFGQNFLHDKNQLAKVVAAASIERGDLVLEVGPGTGTLTEALLEAGATVIASEIDTDLADLVESRLGDRIVMVRGDCLGSGRRLSDAIMEAIGDRPFQLVANLPYQVASSLMVGLLMTPACLGQVVMIQNEVADRLLATRGTKAYGPLTVIVQTLGSVRRVATVPPTSFWPAPTVTSAIVRIDRAEKVITDPQGFARFVTALMSQRRKQLGGVLGRDHDYPEGIMVTDRSGQLSPEQFQQLWAAGAWMWLPESSR
jgi:16S rRNA (adenine1518-N6/adenine1519-N6)-dimethyltransferase